MTPHEYLSQSSVSVGACYGVLAAQKYLRLIGMRDAADKLLDASRVIQSQAMANVYAPPEQIIPPEQDETLDVLPTLPDSWPFPPNPLPPNAGEGEI